MKKRSQKGGLYHPRHERDACGTGFVADTRGRRTHSTLKQALVAVGNLSHRGAISADGLSGDGAGVLTQIPHELLRRDLEARGARLERDDDLAVGMLFLPADPQQCCRCVEIVEEAARQAGLDFLGWRRVPVDERALGEKARATLPAIRQALMRRPAGLTGERFERLLYLTRKRIERRAGAAGAETFYIPSFSHRTIVYKGLMVAEQLDRFYGDLADPLYRTALALFHQRYSTNTFPVWRLAQPFRLLGHNGEINTLLGNESWMRAREQESGGGVWAEAFEELLPIIEAGGSDSAALDNVLELLTLSGRSCLHAMMMLVPEAYEERPGMEPEVRSFFEYHASLTEPWDGPAALVFSDGRYAAACLDRNGLRPQRYCITEEGTVVLGSEAGIVPLPEEAIVRKGRLGPGQMLAVDTIERRVLEDAEIKREAARRRPYARWVERHRVRVPQRAYPVAGAESAWDGSRLAQQQKLFGYGTETLERLLAPMLYEAVEPVGSMGDDTPLAALSGKPQLLPRYFKQRFAQVTNPPIDPLRERSVMSLRTLVGSWSPLLEEQEESARLIDFPSPILSEAELAWLGSQSDPGLRSCTLSARFRAREGPQAMLPALEALCAEAERRVDEGFSVLILSDRACSREWAPIPVLLATSAVHHHLIRARKRMQASIVCDTGEPREDHHFACLIGYGATLVHPYLALESVRDLARQDPRGSGISVSQAEANYRKAVENGLLKIMSKMGISPLSSYHGAQIFEAVGLEKDLVERYFSGTESRIGGVGLTEIATDVLHFHAEAYGHDNLRDHGIYRFRRQGEYHSLNPGVFKALHRAVREQSWEAYQEYARVVDERDPCNLRDLLEWKRGPEPVPLEEVEAGADIARRFCTQAMSLGAVSREAHEVLAVAMNRLGGKSNSGEGGEDRERYYPYAEERLDRSRAAWHPRPGDWANSAIKQVASGRFGVTPEYLVSAREIEIKMAQGSKPGEGGHIPGHKVTEEIASLRRSHPGVTLISPPPHHDIYSIEDLAQLIYDLKRVNRHARVCVKLVSGAGIGAVAAGVVKGYADTIQISGHDGGTGASPLSSIKHAGLPWELGLAETQQVLTMNGLRERVSLRVDGGLKTGRDVVMAALLGAEEFGFGTAGLVAAGCVMARQCHLNTCPVGVATQREDLRRRFPGQPEHVIAFFLFVAEQVRLILAAMGFRRLEEIIGRTDRLALRTDLAQERTGSLDPAAVLGAPGEDGSTPQRWSGASNDRPETGLPLDEIVWLDCEEAVLKRRPVRQRYRITNRERSVGARLAGEIARHTRDRGLAEGAVRLTFRGSAGQSFGAFCNRGMHLVLEGEAQDYVGKGMYGGEIVLMPPPGSRFSSHENVILGNTVLYGATGGALFAAGIAGERLCVRNSGATAVVEGCGDHGCEYMTDGRVVILGETGRNFAAGMSGGLAHVLDLEGRFVQSFNAGMAGIERLGEGSEERELLELIRRHHDLTYSRRAAWVLERWTEVWSKFWLVRPRLETRQAEPSAGLPRSPSDGTISRSRKTA